MYERCISPCVYVYSLFPQVLMNVHMADASHEQQQQEDPDSEPEAGELRVDMKPPLDMTKS